MFKIERTSKTSAIEDAFQNRRQNEPQSTISHWERFELKTNTQEEIIISLLPNRGGEFLNICMLKVKEARRVLQKKVLIVFSLGFDKKSYLFEGLNMNYILFINYGKQPE